MARQRDYRAEERRRNEIAVELGFDTRAQLRGARKRGATLSARAARELDRKVARGEINEINRWTGSVLSASDINFMRKRAKDWSNLHSRSPRSRYKANWSDDTVIMYYQTYVNQYSPDGNRFPVIGFGAFDDSRNDDLIIEFFSAMGLTAAQIETFNYAKKD